MSKTKMKLTRFSEQEIEDLLSAITFFIRKYDRKKESPMTMGAMERLKKKLWKVIQEAK